MLNYPFYLLPYPYLDPRDLGDLLIIKSSFVQVTLLLKVLSGSRPFLSIWIFLCSLLNASSSERLIASPVKPHASLISS